MKRVLIIGGAGEIGHHLEQKLIGRGTYIPFIFDRERLTRHNYFRGDINDIFSLENAFKQTMPDVVVHLAAMVSRKECEETPALAIQTNAIGTLNVVEMCKKYNSYLIYSGSSEEYGEAFYGGRYVTEDTPFGTPTSIYSMTKRMSEEIIQYYAEHKGVPACTVRFFMLYSETEQKSDYRSALSRFVNKAIAGDDIPVHVDTERSWCYIDDAVEAVARIIDRRPSLDYETYLIGKDEPIKTSDLAFRIVQLFKSESITVETDPEPTIIPIKRASFKKMEDHYNWVAKISLDEGLERIRKSTRGE